MEHILNVKSEFTATETWTMEHEPRIEESMHKSTVKNRWGLVPTLIAFTKTSLDAINPERVNTEKLPTIDLVEILKLATFLPWKSHNDTSLCRRYHLVHIISILFSAFYAIRCFLWLLIPEDDLVTSSYLSDWPAFFGGYRLFARFCVALWACLSFCLYFLMYLEATNHPQSILGWLKPFEYTARRVEARDIGLDPQSAAKFWYRTHLSFQVAKWSMVNCTIIGSGCLCIILFVFKPADLRWPSSWLWAPIDCLMPIHVMSILTILIASFHSLTFYLHLRFKRSLQHLSVIERFRYHSKTKLVEAITRQISYHNESCMLLAEYNRFWCKFIAINYLFISAISCLGIYLATFSREMFPIVRFAYLVFAMTTFLALAFTVLSAGYAAKTVSYLEIFK